MANSDSDDRVKVLLFGLGAIGGFYAFILGRNSKVSLSVIARSNYDAVKTNGLRIESVNHGAHEVNIDHVLKSPSEAPFKYDYIVCAHKAIKPDTIPPLFKDVSDDNTVFCIMQNGVGNEDPFRATFPNNSIISCVVWVGAVQKTPGVITHTTSENTEMGLFPNAKLDSDLEKSRLDRFAGIMRDGGTVISVEKNIQLKRWEKVVWNAAWNPFTTLTGVEVQTYLNSSPEAMATTRQLMTEMITVARKCDVMLEYDLVDVLINRVLALPPLFSSMYVDSKEGRPLEVDVIVGTPMKKANEFGLDVPVLRTIYSLVSAINGRLSKP